MHEAATPAPGARRRWSLLVPVVALLAGLLFATSAETANGTDLRSGRRVQLADLIVEQEREVARVEARARQLRAEVQSAAELEAARDARVAAARRGADALAAAAGLGAVTGPGLTVALDDAPRLADGASYPGDPSPDDLVVHQQDVQAVVNALWAGGAEAMQIMDDRVISTTAVRCVGNTLLLHGAVYSPPFTITAIGDEQRLRAALDSAPGVEVFRRYSEAYGLGYSVTTLRSVDIPAYDGPITLPHVRAG